MSYPEPSRFDTARERAEEAAEAEAERQLWAGEEPSDEPTQGPGVYRAEVPPEDIVASLDPLEWFEREVARRRVYQPSLPVQEEVWHDGWNAGRDQAERRSRTDRLVLIAVAVACGVVAGSLVIYGLLVWLS